MGTHTPRIAVLGSGGGTTAEVVAAAIHHGELDAEIGLVITDQPDAYILQRAEDWNEHRGFDVETAVINGKTHPNGRQGRGQTDEESEAIAELLTSRGIDVAAFLGYMRIARGELIDEYGFLPALHESPFQARALNTHPGILPYTRDTYGEMTAAKALAGFLAGDIEHSEHSVHVVAEEIDAGPMVARHRVPILATDTVETLSRRTQRIEKQHIAEDIGAFLFNQQVYRLER